MSTITTTPIVAPREAMDASSILAELAVAPGEPSVVRAAAELLPGISDRLRRATAAPGTEDDDLLAVARAVGIVIERTH
ncbi:hypothetical protein [Streptomyces sp. NPDC048623]|uniref:hypothetical protein n=1 Tax=Streptomyces sp. NPDC048623 TaxID=3155761 RepID=UPI003437C90A